MEMWVRKYSVEEVQGDVELDGRKHLDDLNVHFQHGFKATCIVTLCAEFTIMHLMYNIGKKTNEHFTALEFLDGLSSTVRNTASYSA